MHSLDRCTSMQGILKARFAHIAKESAMLSLLPREASVCPRITVFHIF